MPYALTATMGDQARSHALHSPNDFVATAEATNFVVGAAAYDTVWETGRIELRDPSGKLIHERPPRPPRAPSPPPWPR